MADVENVIIIGSGPAGYTAALYTARANLNPLVIEGFLWGGLLQQTTDVENYPGYPEGIMGPEMMQQFRDQAERFGTRFITDNATKFEPGADGEPHKVWIEDDLYEARAVILAMGAEHKKLGVPGEEELGGRGVSYCATCDAAFYKDRTTIIVGGGDSRDGGGDLPRQVLFQGHDREPPRRVPRLEDHARARPRDREHRVADAVRRRGVPGRRGRPAGPRAAAQRRDRRAARAADGRRVHRDRPRAAVRDRRPASWTSTPRATSRPRASRRARTYRGRLRRRRPRRPHVPPGRDRGRLRAVRPRWTPSGTCATTRACRPRRPSRAPATSPKQQWAPPPRARSGASPSRPSRAAAAATSARRSRSRTSRTRSSSPRRTSRTAAAIPAELTCDGAGRAPTIVWRAMPPETTELVIVVDDPDAPDGTFTHWTVYGLTAATGSGLAPEGQLPGRRQGAASNSAGKDGWTPPCPPEGDDPHRYVFTMYALREASGLEPGAEPDAVNEAVEARHRPRHASPAPYRRGLADAQGVLALLVARGALRADRHVVRAAPRCRVDDRDLLGPLAAGAARAGDTAVEVVDRERAWPRRPRATDRRSAG